MEKHRLPAITRWSGRIARLPNFHIEMREVLVSGNRVIVRSELTGVPAGTFMGIDPQGRSFRIMTIDIHEIDGDKIIRSYHLEDWGRGLRQLRGEAQ